MKTITLPGAFLGTMLILWLIAVPAHAQFTITYVSGLGNDDNPCTRTSPCSVFPKAMQNTAVNGEVRCLDLVTSIEITITKSITIDCHEVPALILAAGGPTCIIMNLSTQPRVDPLQTVRLRNLNCNGSGEVGDARTRSGTRGIEIVNAKAVFLDDMRIEGFVLQGVRDVRTTPFGKLYIRNSIIRDNGGAGVAVAGTGNPQVNAVVENSHLTGNAAGVAVGANNAVMIARSVLTGNTVAGIFADPNAVISADDNVITSNPTGVQAGGGATVRLSNNNIGSQRHRHQRRDHVVRQQPDLSGRRHGADAGRRRYPRQRPALTLIDFNAAGRVGWCHCVVSVRSPDERQRNPGGSGFCAA